MCLTTGLLNTEFFLNIVVLFFLFSAPTQKSGPCKPGAAHHSFDHPGSPGPVGPRAVCRAAKVSSRQLHCEGSAHERQGTNIHIYSILQIHAENLGLLFVTSIIEAKFIIVCELSL